MSRRILLADDSVTIQKVIELTFMDDDYEVRAVGNGDEALAMLTALTVDFVIADVHMPGASGYEVCRRSKQLRPEVPVLLLVGTFEPFDEAQAHASGADSYLKKPFDSQELLGRVHELLGPAATPAGGAPEGAGAHPEGTSAAAAPPAVGAAGGVAAAEPASTPSAPASAEAAVHPAIAGTTTLATATPATPATIAADAGAAEHPAAAGAPSGAAPAGHGIRLTGEIEAAASWQEFELEAEPELVPDPWPDQAPAPPPAAAFLPAVQHHEQPFALGDLDEGTGAEPGKPAGGSRPPVTAGQPPAFAAAPADRAAPAAPAAPASGFHDQPFTLGEPLDDRVLLDEAEAEEDKQQAAAAPAAASPPAAASTPAGAPAQRATQAEPVAWLGAAPAGSRPADESPTIGERAGAPLGQEAALGGTAASEATGPAGATSPAVDVGPAGDAEKQTAAAAGNGQPAAQTTAGIAAALGDQDVDRIARRVVELIGDKVVRDIAWEVIPDLAEVVIKDRLRELESQIE
jgi:CheY-like chemotaxis protein